MEISRMPLAPPSSEAEDSTQGRDVDVAEVESVVGDELPRFPEPHAGAGVPVRAPGPELHGPAARLAVPAGSDRDDAGPEGVVEADVGLGVDAIGGEKEIAIPGRERQA